TKEITTKVNDAGIDNRFDQDATDLKASKRNLAETTRKKLLIHANFNQLKEKLKENNIDHVDVIIFDLGVSSPQLDEGDRGFSYRYDSKLDMRMNQSNELSAYDVVNSWPYKDLVKILFTYGEEKFSKQIARRI